MALPEFTLRQLLEAGVHFGHQTQRWNPRMEEFIYGERNGIHIMDLTQTVPMLDAALNVTRETVAKGGRILFVGTKRQASTAIAEAAEKCAQYYMNHRWLGGTLTNWQTVSQSINRLKALDEKMATGSEGLTKKERLGMEREQSKLQASLGGITQMGGVPDLLFVIDVKKEALAVAEANKLGIPVIAVVDTNCSPSGVDYIIPGNDDAARAISLYCDLIARSALDGMTEQMGAAGGRLKKKNRRVSPSSTNLWSLKRWQQILQRLKKKSLKKKRQQLKRRPQRRRKYPQVLRKMLNLSQNQQLKQKKQSQFPKKPW